MIEINRNALCSFHISVLKEVYTGLPVSVCPSFLLSVHVCTFLLHNYQEYKSELSATFNQVS